MNFLLGEMTYLRYFIPIIIEGNKRNITSNIFYKSNIKYSNPEAYKEYLKELSIKYNFNLYNISKLNNNPSDVTFLLEGQYYEYIKYKTKTVSITSNIDFEVHYGSYVNKVDYIVLLSEFYSKKFNKKSDKNLFLGSTKYDVILPKINEIKTKYNLPDKNVLIMYPYGPWIDKINLPKIYKKLKELNYNIVVKTRGKNQASGGLRGDRYFLDKYWYPHDTMELMTACDLVITFDSSCIEECIMLNKFTINFKAGPKGYRKLPELFNTDCCIDLERNEIDKLKESITKINIDKSKFKEVRKKFLYENDFKTSERILNILFGG